MISTHPKPPNGHPPSASSGRLADRLVAARHSRFVGRAAELALLRDAVLQETPPFVALHIYGPGGVGKTALMRAYTQIATEAGRHAIYLDGRNIEASPSGFTLALRQALGLTTDTLYPTIPTLPADSVLLIDTYETIGAVDSWLRETLLPQLPAHALVVIAGRNPPASAWMSELDWAALTHIVPLRNLRPDESQSLLTTRGIPPAQHANLLAITHGHPLALCLIADAVTQGKTLDELALHKQPDIVRVLLERFVDDIPSPIHRLALEICVMVWATTEALLAEAMGPEDAHTTFTWLRSLPFIEPGSEGLFPHDLAREALDADYRWRNADAHRHLYQKLIRSLYTRVYHMPTVVQQQRVWFDIFYLARHNSYMAPFFDWRAIGDSYAEAAVATDLPPILAMVEAHEGAAQAKLVAYWFGRQPHAFRVYRTGNEVVGFMAHLALHEATAEDIATDPALPAALAYVEEHGPARPDEEIMHLRFWMGRDAHQGVSTAINLTAINASIYWTTHPKLAWNFIATHDPEYLKPHFTMINMQRSPDADFTVEGHRYGVFSHDWRIQNAADWMELKVDRYGLTEVDLASLESELADMQPLPSAPPTPILVLSEPEFAEAVRRALRDYTRPDQLTTNPLMRSRLVLGQSSDEPLMTLRAHLDATVAMLKQNPKDEKLYRAVWHTYFVPAATQEQAAEQLDLPFSTYRYHLTNGVARIVAWLWHAELHGQTP